MESVSMVSGSRRVYLLFSSLRYISPVDDNIPLRLTARWVGAPSHDVSTHPWFRDKLYHTPPHNPGLYLQSTWHSHINPLQRLWNDLHKLHVTARIPSDCTNSI